MRLKGNVNAKDHASSLRRSPSLPETLLWQQLRGSGLGSASAASTRPDHTSSISPALLPGSP